MKGRRTRGCGLILAAMLGVGCVTPQDHWSQYLPGQKLHTVAFHEGPYHRNLIVCAPSVVGEFTGAYVGLVAGGCSGSTRSSSPRSSTTY
jgi:hypothetical protein